MGFALKDAALKVTKALPTGAASTTSDPLDLKHGTKGDHLANCELRLSAPAVTTTELPDTKTFTYIIEHDDDVAFGSAATLFSAFVQTGAAGAGAAANSLTRRLPVDVKRYVRSKCTGVATGAGSTASMTLELLF